MTISVSDIGQLGKSPAEWVQERIGAEKVRTTSMFNSREELFWKQEQRREGEMGQMECFLLMMLDFMACLYADGRGP